MRKSILLYPALLVTLSGCVVTYGNVPDASRDSLPKITAPQPLSYYVNLIPYANWLSQGDEGTSPIHRFLWAEPPNWYPLGMKDFREAGVREVQRALTTSGMFSELIIGDTVAPDTGTYVNVHFRNDPPSQGAVTVALAQCVGCVPPLIIIFPLCFFGAFGIVPYYSDQGGLTVEYHLYQARVHRHTYQYRIHKKGAGGLLLLPFAWLNFFTDDLKDALRGTTLQFLIDAQHDGNF